MRQKNVYRITVLFLIAVFASVLLSGVLSSCKLFKGMAEVLEVPEEDPVPGTADESDKHLAEEENIDADKIDEIEEIIPKKVWIEDIIPKSIKDVLVEHIKDHPELDYVQDSRDAEVFLEINPANAITDGSTAYRELNVFYVMTPATYFFNLIDRVEWEDLKAWWSGDKESLNYISEDNAPVIMALEEENYNILTKLLGEPINDNIKIMNEADILDGFSEDDIIISITAFNSIDKKIKVLELSGLSVFDRDLEYSDYPLAFSVVLHGENETIEEEVFSYFQDLEITNRDMSKFTSLMMTGVTAMVRGTAQRMERNGILYPGEQIADTLRDADITHISNEVPFVEGCDVLMDRFPFFCSRPEYIELLEYVGTDVIELTGNHMNDHGHDWFVYTLEMYDEREWPYYGGGRDLEQSYKPAVIESNGNSFAFLGFNWWGPEYDWATENTPGSAPPNFEDFEEIIKELKTQGHIVIFTFQYLESYHYEPTAQQIIDFRRMIDAGADIVSGSQSHHPMGMEFYEDGFINYGLGNLFFDQMNTLGTRQELIITHMFYEGKHINTIIITAMLEDYSQPRLASPGERFEILSSVFGTNIQ